MELIKFIKTPKEGDVIKIFTKTRESFVGHGICKGISKRPLTREYNQRLERAKKRIIDVDEMVYNKKLELSSKEYTEYRKSKVFKKLKEMKDYAKKVVKEETEREKERKIKSFREIALVEMMDREFELAEVNFFLQEDRVKVI